MLPKTVNVRAPAMWSFIQKCIDVKNKRIIDFGCGYADLILVSALNGAKECLGIEKDYTVWSEAIRRVHGQKNINLVMGDIEENIHIFFGQFDIFYCTAVLPYLSDPKGFVERAMKVAPVGIIECQYIGDGPGYLAHDDKEMKEWLLWCDGVDEATIIGKTLVEDRQMFRTLWKLSRWNNDE